jgi:hypothetical protein
MAGTKPNPTSLNDRLTQIVAISDASGEIINPATAPGERNARVSDALGYPMTVDAFGRLRVSEPYTIFDNSLTHPAADALFWSTLLSGAGATSTYDRNTSKNTLAVNANGEFGVRQTKTRFKYQPGKSHLVKLTGVYTCEAGVIKRVGYMDFDNVGLATINSTPRNGIYFENENGVFSWVIVNNGTESSRITQNHWNIDKLNGHGASSKHLNTNAAQICYMDLEWLGVGSVLVGFFIDRKPFPVHIFNHANIDSLADVYMRTANLPVAYQIISTGGAVITGLKWDSVITKKDPYDE